MKDTRHILLRQKPVPRVGRAGLASAPLHSQCAPSEMRLASNEHVRAEMIIREHLFLVMCVGAAGRGGGGGGGVNVKSANAQCKPCGSSLHNKEQWIMTVVTAVMSFSPLVNDEQKSAGLNEWKTPPLLCPRGYLQTNRRHFCQYRTRHGSG